jgi:hypothetical protein
VPNGYEIGSADERAGVRRVGYAPNGDRDYQIAVAASSPSMAVPARGRNPRQVRVRGHDATLSTLTDEGHDYGFEVVWDERDDLRLAVEGSNGPTEQDTLAVAKDVRGISEPDWQRLELELSVDTHVGRVDPNAAAVEVVRGDVGADPFVLTVLVPGSFPLGPEDRRLDCFHLTFRGTTTKDECPGHPIWSRVGGQLFVFGDAKADIGSLRISPSFGSSFASFSVDTTPAPSGPPTRFYVAPLPEGSCAVAVDDAVGGQRGPGVTGPLTETGDDYARCVAAENSGAPTVGPPTTPTSVN